MINTNVKLIKKNYDMSIIEQIVIFNFFKWLTLLRTNIFYTTLFSLLFVWFCLNNLFIALHCLKFLAMYTPQVCFPWIILKKNNQHFFLFERHFTFLYKHIHVSPCYPILQMKTDHRFSIYHVTLNLEFDIKDFKS